MAEYVGFDVSKEAAAFCVMDCSGRISKHGGAMVRALLYEADTPPRLRLIPWEAKAKGHYHEARRPNSRSRLRRQPCSRRRTKGSGVLDRETGIRQPRAQYQGRGSTKGGVIRKVARYQNRRSNRSM